MILLEVWNCVMCTPGSAAKVQLGVVAARSTKRRSTNVDVKAKIQRFGADSIVWPKVAFADVDRAVASLLQ